MYMSSKRVNDLLVGLCLGISFMVRNEMIPFVNKDDSYYIMTFIIALAFIKWMINGFHINIKNRRNILEIGMQYFTGALIYSLISGLSDKNAIEFAVAASCLKQTIEGDYNRVSVDDVNKLVNSCGNGRVER